MNDSPVFIVGLHKSGTSLLRSLFDGHSQLCVIPIETHYFQNMKYWVDNEYRRQRPAVMSEQEILERFCKWIHLCNISNDPLADSVATGIFNEENFRKEFSQVRRFNDDASRIRKYFEAVYYAIEGKQLPSNLRIIEKSVENAEFGAELKKIFPKAQFIHIIRNPYANLVALRRYKSRGFGYPIMMRLLRTMYNAFYFLYKNQNLINDYYVIRYEDLVSNPETEMKRICTSLDIPWQDILLKPTFLQKPWAGNSTSGQKYKEISNEHLDKWKKDIHPMEIFYINNLFPFVLKDFGYTISSYSSGFWLPAKGENPKRYIANRIFRYMTGKDNWNA